MASSKTGDEEPSKGNKAHEEKTVRELKGIINRRK